MNNKLRWSKINHFIGILLYAGILTYLWFSLTTLIAHYKNLGFFGFVLNVVTLFTAVVGPLYAIYFMIQMIDGSLKLNTKEYDINKLGENPPRLHVIVPIHNVDPSILADSLDGFKKETYPNFDVWVGDDSTNEELREQCEKVTKERGYTYFYYPNKKFKAGMENIILEQDEFNKCKYVAMFDIDHIPVDNILTKFVAILEQHQEFAFVQAKFGFRNVKNLLHIWEAMYSNQLFCSQNARIVNKNVIFTGSTACFRRNVINKIPEGILAEDFELTIDLASRGYRGYWLDDIGSTSLLPETIDHQMSQLDRWMTGQAGTLVDNIGKMFGSKMSLSQIIDFIFSSTVVFATTSFYFLGLFYGIIYYFRLPLFQNIYLHFVTLILLPAVMIIVYIATLAASTIYAVKSGTYPFKLWHIPFFLLFSSLSAPFFIYPVLKGLFRQNKLIPGKTKWNRKVHLYRWSIVFTIFGTGFSYLTALSLMDMMSMIHWYGFNYFWVTFLSVGLTFSSSFPFIFVSRKLYKEENFKKTDIFH